MTPLDRRMRATILVVDDEEMSRDLIARILRERGCVVHTAPNTEDAYAELASGQIDLMLCDVMMPDETGTEFLARLRLDYPDLAVGMGSGLPKPHIPQFVLEIGPFGAATKPFT